jgi:hypothetical protein
VVTGWRSDGTDRREATIERPASAWCMTGGVHRRPVVRTETIMLKAAHR